MSESCSRLSELDGHDGVLLDLDGTLYSGTEPVAGAAEAVALLRETDIAVRYVTNNAASATADVADRLAGFGLPAEQSEVYTSADAASVLLHDRLRAGARVLVLGTESLAERVRQAGLEPVREAGSDVEAVVQGHSPDTAWRDLAQACLAVRAGALWVACNADATLPSERGELPGNGAMIAALRTATAVEPAVAGKPQPPLLRLAARQADLRAPLVVGDRLETDIAGGAACDMDTLLVLSGVTTPAGLLAAGPHERPRYVAADVRCLTEPLAEVRVPTADEACAGWLVVPDGACLAVESAAHTGEADVYSLLCALCAQAWSSGVTDLRARDARARAALAELDLPLAA